MTKTTTAAASAHQATPRSISGSDSPNPTTASATMSGVITWASPLSSVKNCATTMISASPVAGSRTPGGVMPAIRSTSRPQPIASAARTSGQRNQATKSVNAPFRAAST